MPVRVNQGAGKAISMMRIGLFLTLMPVRPCTAWGTPTPEKRKSFIPKASRRNDDLRRSNHHPAVRFLETITILQSQHHAFELRFDFNTIIIKLKIENIENEKITVFSDKISLKLNKNKRKTKSMTMFLRETNLFPVLNNKT